MYNKKAKSLEEDLINDISELERKRTIYWNKYDPYVDLRSRWRVSMMRHLFHILPGQKILEIGAGNGRFTSALIDVTRNECKITAAIFSPEYRSQIEKEVSGFNVDIVYLDSFPGPLTRERFDFVIANHLLANRFSGLFLHKVKSLIKPGGGLLLFEPNPWNPYSRIRKAIQSFLPFCFRRPRESFAFNRLQIFSLLSEIGYTQINVLPYDFLYAPIPKFLLWPAKNLSIIMENFPYLRNLAGSLCIWAKNPAAEGKKDYTVDLCMHDALFGKVSFVVPCHNEEMNIPLLIEKLNDFYGKYMYEIIIVDDNSTDRTAEVTEGLMEKYQNIRLIKRSPPNGVGLALRDGICQASGEYILIMDCDFQHIIPEMRDLFDAIANGADVAIGSRFSRESVLINYGFTKIIANRAFHLLANLFLGKHFRDVSNNLKIFRREVAKKLIIESNDFAANAETGLKPILLGYKVAEVPISWINRSINMGFSTFRIFRVGPNYGRVLFRLAWERITGLGDVKQDR